MAAKQKVTKRYLYHAPTKGREGYIYDREFNVVVDRLDEKKRPLNNLANELNALHAENEQLKMWVSRFYACLKQTEESGIWFSATMAYERDQRKAGKDV